MVNLRTDSLISRRLVVSFLNFLRTVEPASDVDLESIEVVMECLRDIFKINSSSDYEDMHPNLLIDLLSSYEANKEQADKSDLCRKEISVFPPTAASSSVATDKDSFEEKSLDEESGDGVVKGISTDEIFSRFCDALEKIHFFKASPAGDDDHVQFAKLKRILDDALMEVKSSGSHLSDVKALAETLKRKGNLAIQSKCYADAIEYYTCAIALCESNAVYYCNRAAAYTQISKYAEAIADCEKSIDIHPNYSKAYSRLGMAYYAQGNYSDAINLGYLKALHLDPDNISIRENIQVAEQKLRERVQEAEQSQQASGANSNYGQDSSNQARGTSSSNGVPPFMFATNVPPGLANVFVNMAGNQFPDQPGHDGTNEHEIRMGGNINLNFGENVPAEVSGAWRSMMEMFTSQGPQGNPLRDQAPS